MVVRLTIIGYALCTNDMWCLKILEQSQLVEKTIYFTKTVSNHFGQLTAMYFGLPCEWDSAHHRSHTTDHQSKHMTLAVLHYISVWKDDLWLSDKSTHDKQQVVLDIHFHMELCMRRRILDVNHIDDGLTLIPMGYLIVCKEPWCFCRPKFVWRASHICSDAIIFSIE